MRDRKDNVNVAELIIGDAIIGDKISDEICFHASGGTGFAAEQANNLYDNFMLTPAKIVGDNNVKNGADRMVWFTPVQTKYYSTASASVNAAFENNGHGAYKYITEHGRIMDLEVPKEQYDSAVEIMRNKILAGQVLGVNNPNQADEIVRAGHYTYNQAKNIAEAGNIDSVIYDVSDGAVVGMSVFGISAVINYGLMVIRGTEPNEAAKEALINAGKSGGIALASTVIAGQFAKECSTEFINMVGNGTIAIGSTLLVLSAIDVVKVFNGQISIEKAARNLGCNTAGLFAGKEGYEIGTAIGTAICPGLGTVLGGIFGACIFGSIARSITETLLDTFFEDGTDDIRKMFNSALYRVSREYMLSKEELDALCSSLLKFIDENFLETIKKSPNSRKYVMVFVEKQTKKLVKNRPQVVTCRSIRAY